MADNAFRCGFVAVVGRPNVGKSTLTNALVGTKVSIVTAKPQTTRHRILGIRTLEDAQIVFVDTPGLHRAANREMNRVMNRAAISALADADLALFVTEAGRFTDEDGDVLARITRSGVPSIALLNKVDRIHPKERLLEALAECSARHAFADIIPISATRGDNLDAVMRAIPAHLPASPPLFPAEMQTDRSPGFRAAEVIREKLTLMLHDELPYGLTVQIERYAEEDGKYAIDAVIWVERESQKGIVVGRGGQRLRAIGRAARVELKEQLGAPVHLETWVKVRQNWADNAQELRALGIDVDA